MSGGDVLGPPSFDCGDHLRAEHRQAWRDAMELKGMRDAVEEIVVAAWRAGYAHAEHTRVAMRSLAQALAVEYGMPSPPPAQTHVNVVPDSSPRERLVERDAAGNILRTVDRPLLNGNGRHPAGGGSK